MFVHGLESGPSGEKVQGLRAQGLEVVAADMQMSLKRLDRCNSVSRNLLRTPEVQAAGVVSAALVGLGLGRRSVWPVGLAGVALGAWWSGRGEALTRQAIMASYRRCVEVQREAIARFEPDVVLGSSWGGAITLELMLRGHWQGPAVLLAPAFHKVHRAMGLDPVGRLAGLEPGSTLIFHDPSDDTVPLEDSQALSEQLGLPLHAVDAGGHRLMGLVEDGRLLESLCEVAG
ncbi:hypothetical protein DL240_18780 [Lujinxingia litoralis]|uniref:Alpha/beta hydrolase n=2 Tax=Lujinxingia litoralis TaxID=2211119 RepID=A0A328C2S5_9DELT|nr:hypothetical protein DL240_18780 [Lujinxingia litoralis]